MTEKRLAYFLTSAIRDASRKGRKFASAVGPVLGWDVQLGAGIPDGVRRCLVRLLPRAVIWLAAANGKDASVAINNRHRCTVYIHKRGAKG